MRTHTLVSTNGFLIDKDITKFVVSDLKFTSSKSKKDKIFYEDKDVVNFIGHFIVKNNRKCDFAYSESEVKLSGFVTNSIIQKEMYLQAEKLSMQASAFFLCLWLVKDNSICVKNTICLGTDLPLRNSIFFNTNNHTVFTSEGTTRTEFFSKKELNNARSYYKKYMLVCPNSSQYDNKDLKMTEEVIYNPIKYNEYNRIERATTLLSTARTMYFLPFRISMYIQALECLFMNEDNNEIQFKLTHRIAFYLTNNVAERQRILNTVKDCYTIRSHFLHGAQIKKKKSKGSIDYPVVDLVEKSVELDCLLRNIFRKIIRTDSNKFNDNNQFEAFLKNLIIG